MKKPQPLYRNDRIRGAIAQKGLRNRDVADKAKCSLQTVSVVRGGRNTTVATLRAIAKVLDLRLRDLFEFDDAA